MKVTRNPVFIFKYSEVKEKHQVDASIADSVFHLDLLKYHGLYVEHPATLLKRRACCIPQLFWWLPLWIHGHLSNSGHVSSVPGFSLIQKYGVHGLMRENREGPKQNLESPLCIMRSQHLK